MAKLPYDPSQINRELAPYYISATDEQINEMMNVVGITKIDDVFKHIDNDNMFEGTPEVCERLEYQALADHLEELSLKNINAYSFLGDGLQQYQVNEMAPFTASIRGLTTAYTPYQPERSQGTLQTLWIYASTISALTGFEAVNASFYDRSTTLFEAFNTALRITRKKNTVFISEGIYPGDLEVIDTLAKETQMNIKRIPMNKETGLIDIDALKKMITEYKDDLAAIAFPQVNHFGNLEDIDTLTDLTSENEILSIAIIDPMLLASGGLKEPAKWGSQSQGTTMFVGEGQHLAIAANFGGPGLGIFGIRFNENNKTMIRSTAGRFVGKAKDEKGNDCLCMVLSTREQHIRREKATSNICSNQSFVATMTGAAILGRGENGMQESVKKARSNALRAFQLFNNYEEFEGAFQTPFFNEFTLKFNGDVNELIEKARNAEIHIGVNVSERGNDNLLMVSLSDIQGEEHFKVLENFLSANFKQSNTSTTMSEINGTLLRKDPVGLPNFKLEDLKKFYLALGEQNVSPDDNIYPLGSCTMKYNPHINDWAAGLPGFTEIHPQAPEADAQGCLEVLYGIQEMFKSITGLPGTVIQPVAGAQGELVGLKMFQAYHRDRGEGDTRNIVLIPRSAHGTNPATATMAGFETKKVDGKEMGIITINANDEGQIDFDQLKSYVEKYKNNIAGIMVTNPNTAGIFEARFKEMSELIHEAGGLVYMDGANMNAIASWVDLDKIGVDAVHNNLHKTWTIPHGGGGPGDAIVGVSSRLLPFIPGLQVRKNDKGLFETFRTEKSIGSFHRHHGNFAHKVRAYTYLRALGSEGIQKMSAFAVLSAKYLFEKIKGDFPTLPVGSENVPRMHEFIITLSKETFDKIAASGTVKTNAIAKIGKLFLDFGLHAPTVAFPEQYGLMIEPTESYTKDELDRFLDVLKSIRTILEENPEVLTSAPHFTPISKVDEVFANKQLILAEKITELPNVRQNVINPKSLDDMNISDITKKIVAAHSEA